MGLSIGYRPGEYGGVSLGYRGAWRASLDRDPDTGVEASLWFRLPDDGELKFKVSLGHSLSTRTGLYRHTYRCGSSSVVTQWVARVGRGRLFLTVLTQVRK